MKARRSAALVPRCRVRQGACVELPVRDSASLGFVGVGIRVQGIFLATNYADVWAMLLAIFRSCVKTI